LSIVAEFAAIIHEKHNKPNDRLLTPTVYPSRCEKVYDVKAVIFDLYGTLVNYWRDEFSDSAFKEKALLEAFRKTAEFFRFAEYLAEMNPDDFPERTLRDLYQGLIMLNHEKSLKKGVTFPEVRIEEVWEVIIMMLERHGYDWAKLDLGNKNDLARCMAFYYNFNSLGRGLYPGVTDTLITLKKDNYKLGILSNAQFYSLIDLNLYIRIQSNGTVEDCGELFESDLQFFSFEFGVAKPNQALFRKLYDALYEYEILPRQTLFVGNDLSSDIRPAQEAGMLTAFFTGDDKSVFRHDCGGKVVPDIVFNAYDQLPGKISFFEEKNRE